MSEDVGTKLVKALKPVYKSEYEKKLFKSIISALYLGSVSIDEVETILYNIYDNLPAHDVDRSEILKMMDSIYAEEMKPDNGVKSIEKFISEEFDTKLALGVVREVNKVLFPNGNRKTYKLETGSNKWVVMDNQNSEVKFLTFTTVKNQDISDFTRILLCYPHKIVIHDNPISDSGRTFTITWRTKERHFFKTENMTLPEIESYLTDHAYVLSPKHLKGTIASIIQISILENLAEIKNEIETPGFYYNVSQDKLVSVGYEVQPVDIDNLNRSLNLIEDLANYFQGNEDKLATTLKHGLIAPFSFAKKQMGQPLELLIPYLYHYGKSGSGKTTIARIALYYYGQPDPTTNDIGGTEFDTVPRIGEMISRSTFGIVVSEPENCIRSKSCAATLKTCVERVNARRKFKGSRFTNILSLACVQMASNIPLPNIEGLPRRFVQLLYAHSEKKTDDEKKAFMKHFHMEDPEVCSFHRLKYLANFAVHTLTENTEMLKYDWKRLGNVLMINAYDLCEREIPAWLLNYTESVSDEDIDEEEMEELRMFFIKEINRETKKIKEYSRDTDNPILDEYNDEVKEAADFKEKVFHVLNNQLLPYVVLRHKKGYGYDEVCFTSGLRKTLSDNGINCYSISSTAQLLGWDYDGRRINGRPTKCMIVKFEDFLRFLYPEVDEAEEEDVNEPVDGGDDEYTEEQKLLLSDMRKLRDRERTMFL